MIRERPVSYIVKTRATKRMPLSRFHGATHAMLLLIIVLNCAYICKIFPKFLLSAVIILKHENRLIGTKLGMCLFSSSHSSIITK